MEGNLGRRSVTWARWQVKKRLRTKDPVDPTARDLAIDPVHLRLTEAVRPYTMVTPEGLNAVRSTVQYILGRDVPGALVECGVWRGGMSMAMALTAIDCGNTSRDLYLFDTFAGMSEPTERDFDRYRPELDVRSRWEESQRDNRNDWCFAGLEDVARNMASTEYPADKVHLVEGKVEDTIPAQAPDVVALLRIDTDWYESTKHALEHLYPRLSDYGVLILDDYGGWEGARTAVDEYFADLGVDPFLQRVDFLNRLHIKLPRSA